MRTAVTLASGEELIDGRVVDSNSAWLRRRLRALGLETLEGRVIGDGLDSLALALGELAVRADLIVVCGGLGPTEDDRTRAAVAAAAGVPLVESDLARASLERYFQHLQRTPSGSNLRQASIPLGAEVFDNERGTAPGFRATIHGCAVCCLPGVPSEMRWMFEHRVLPWLKAQPRPAGFLEHVWLVIGLSESVLGERIEFWMKRPSPKVVINCHPGWLTVTLSDRDDPAGRERLQTAAREVHDAIGEENVVGVGEDTLAERLVAALREARRTLAVAESCTGGLLAGAITAVPGSSEVFLEGCVTYSNEAKVRTLGVSEEALDRFGAVSAEVAQAMAEGVRRLSHSDFSAAITGVAGPGGGSTEKPVGTVYLCSIDASGTPHGLQIRVPGERELVRSRTVQQALALLLRRTRHLQTGY